MSKRIFLDTNVVIDLLGEREPFYNPIAKVFALAQNKRVRLVASSLTFANAHYILSKMIGAQPAKQRLVEFKKLCEVATTNESIVAKALESTMKDFEDALQYFSAGEALCEAIITRDRIDFRNASIPTMTTEEFLQDFLANN